MSSMKKWISQEPVTRVVDPTLIVSEINKFAHFNLHEVTYEEIDNFSKNIGIKINQDETANGLSFWF